MSTSASSIQLAEQEFSGFFRDLGGRIGASLSGMSKWVERAKDRAIEGRPLPHELEQAAGLDRKGLELSGKLELPRLQSLDETDQRMQGFIRMDQSQALTGKEMRKKIMAARTPHPNAPDAHLSRFQTSQEGTQLVIDQRGADVSLHLERDGEQKSQTAPFSYDRLEGKLSQYLEKQGLEAKSLTHQRTVPARKVFRMFEGLPYMFRPEDPAPMSLELDGQHMTPDRAAKAMARSKDLLQDFGGEHPSVANQTLDFSSAVVDKLFSKEGDLMHDSLKAARDLHYHDQNHPTDRKSVALALTALDPSRFELRASDQTPELFLVDKASGSQGKAIPVNYLEQAFSAPDLKVDREGQVKAIPQVEYQKPEMQVNGMDR